MMDLTLSLVQEIGHYSCLLCVLAGFSHFSHSEVLCEYELVDLRNSLQHIRQRYRRRS